MLINSLAPNLRYLRKKRSLSIQEMSSLLGIEHKTTYYSWERGDSQPNIHMILKIAHEFDVSVDELLKNDLSKRNIQIKEDGKNLFEVEIIPYKAIAGYSTSYADPEWIENNLQKIKIPFKPPMGQVRAFPIEGDSMEPKVADGSYVIGVKLQDPKNEVIEGKDYLIVTRDQGIMYKFFYWLGENAELRSQNHFKHPPIKILGADIIEVWKYFCAII